MSLEKAIADLTKEITLLNQNITYIIESKPVTEPSGFEAPGKTVSHDDLPSDSEPPAEEKPKAKAKPKKKAVEQKEALDEIQKLGEEYDADDNKLDLLTIQKYLTDLSKKDRAVAKSTLEEFVPAGSALKLSSVPESDYEALRSAIIKELG